jgi:hypothetical protein
MFAARSFRQTARGWPWQVDENSAKRNCYMLPCGVGMKTAKQARADAYERHREFRLRNPNYMRDRMRIMRAENPGYDFLTAERRAVLTRERARRKAKARS